MRPLRRAPVLLLAVGIAASFASLEDARADCMASSPFLSPATGAKLPPDPVIYAFVPEHMADPTAKVSSGASISVEKVSSNDTFNSFRLTVKNAPSGRIKVELGIWKLGSHSYYADGEYTIDPVWKKPAGAEVKIASLTKEIDAWTCSHNQTYNLRPSVRAAAYRLEYATSYDDFVKGKRQTAVHPVSLNGFFAPKDEPGEAIVKLGHANCLYETFRWPAALIYAGLVALHPDGSETPASEVPAEVPWSFDTYMFGAMTDAFYEEVHGHTKDGTPVGDAGAREAEPPAPPPDPKGEVSKGLRCGVVSVGETAVGIGLLELLTLLL
jgi:hypothetical protein